MNAGVCGIKRYRLSRHIYLNVSPLHTVCVLYKPCSERRLYLLLRTDSSLDHYSPARLSISPASILSLTLFTIFVSLCKVGALSLIHAVNKWESEIGPFVSLSFIHGLFYTVKCINCPFGCHTVFCVCVISLAALCNEFI